MDVKYLPYLLPNKQKCYVYNFVDHASRWQFKMVFDSYGAMQTERFMRELLRVVPFKIKRLQTDNGSEFTNIFAKKLAHAKKHILDEICEDNGIIKKLIPPGEKELNGLVERSHRQDDNQLYNTIKPTNLQEFANILKDYCEWNNEYRLRRPLGWISSNRYLKIWTPLLIKKEETEAKKPELEIAA
jgi:transposase InsO family protein